MANISTRQLRKNERLILGLEAGTLAAENFLKEYVPTRTEMGQFFTPTEIVDKMITFAGITAGEKVLEPSCGVGNILYYLPKDAIGIELDVEICELAKRVTGKTVINANLFEEWKNHCEFDCIVGNPPFGETPGRFGCDLDVGETRSEIMSIECIWRMLKSGGRAILLLPKMVACGGRNYSKLYKFLEIKGTSLELICDCGTVDFKTTKIGVAIFEMYK